MSSSTVGHFYGVYLLCSQNPEKRYNGKCYIGYTVNPDRRINQHNRGTDFGGAKRTNNKGPWKMVLIVHGFPNNISALQFEWAWQQPTLSSRLKPYVDLHRKQSKESHFQYNIRILSRMLNVGPWQRLPLIVRWLEPQYECEFAPTARPPVHMQIASGQVKIVKMPSSSSAASPPRAIWAPECHLCMQRFEQPARSRIGCLNPLCKLTCHLICLANHIISADARNRGHYIPIAGECPLCERSFMWAALLQHKRKMQALNMEEIEQSDESDDDDDDDAEYAQYESDENNDDQNGADDDDDGDNDVMSSSEDESVECAVAQQQPLMNCDVVYELSD